MKNIYEDSELINSKEKSIIFENRHQFIYGDDCSEREAFLNNLEYSYPIVDNTYSPMAIYMIDYYLPTVNSINFNIDRNRLNLISNSFFNLSIAYNITKRICMDDKLNNRRNYLRLLNNSESLNINSLGEENVKDFYELCNSFKRSMDIFVKLYNDTLEGNYSICDTFSSVSFIDGVEYASDIKKMLGNKAYFALIIANKEDISNLSKKTINGFIGSRINKDVSIKVVTNEDKWNLSYDLNGNSISSTHDYGVVELNEKEKTFTKKRNRRVI